MLGGCSLKATESPKQLLGAECRHQMKRRRVRPPIPAVNSRRLIAGDVLQAARVSTAMEKNISIGLNGSCEQTYCTGSRCIKLDLLQSVMLQFMYCPTTAPGRYPRQESPLSRSSGSLWWTGFSRFVLQCSRFVAGVNVFVNNKYLSIK